MNMIATTTQAASETMSSREIAEMYGKRHDNVLQKIRTLEPAYLEVFGNALNFQLVEYLDAKGESRPEILLNKSQALFVASRFDAVLHAKVQKRWEDLEAQTPAIPNFSNPAEAARAWALAYEQKQIAMVERDQAIATKAEIGTRREATAMNTASQKSKEVNRLKIELDKSKDYASVKAVEIRTKCKFKWVELRRYCNAKEIEIKDIFDANYGTVKTYPAEAWMAVYGIDLDELF